MADIKEISTEELKKKLDAEEDFLLINVLAPSSFEAMHIPGSINIPVSDPDFVEKVGEKAGSKDKEIVLYCSSPTCQASPAATRKLMEAGYTNVFDNPGGLSGWKDVGYELEGAMSNS